MDPRRALLTDPLKTSRHTVCLRAATELDRFAGAFSTPRQTFERPCAKIRNHLPGIDSQFM